MSPLQTTKKGFVYMIYYIEDPDRVKYIGSSLRNRTRDRWQTHKDNYKKYLKDKNRGISIYPYFEQYGLDKFKFQVIKYYEVCDRKHLYTYETLWFNKTRCVNKVVPFQPLKKQQKNQQSRLYYEQNKLRINHKNKQWREDNREKFSEIKKLYKKKNKAIIAEQNKLYRKKNKDKIAEQLKLYYKKNKDKIAKKGKLYRKQNKAIITEKRKSYYEQNKTRISEKNKVKKYCWDCEKHIRKSDITKHNKTKKHINNTLLECLSNL